jgi:hypothetical protein
VKCRMKALRKRNCPNFGHLPHPSGPKLCESCRDVLTRNFIDLMLQMQSPTNGTVPAAKGVTTTEESTTAPATPSGSTELPSVGKIVSAAVAIGVPAVLEVMKTVRLAKTFLGCMCKVFLIHHSVGPAARGRS